ncbi:TlyA family RNA methyltransferase [Pampinifervens florentissimum]|uniref:TlyA family RNA methyltransferase n=1 Tax=Pampinifervens florentissimum TaxID=1632019 RepID=UPI0013B4913D|nr:TlyA family RNA methyltransferase [Hydrogenobacter sp. T-8]QID32903.1 TlyA family RNA methyltransferase [Hydrogenobacter sp. T-8]
MRLDQYLVEKGYVSSREKAQAIIMAGLVYVDGKPITKPGTKIKEGQIIEVKELPKYVSRGGYKLEWAIQRFGLDVKGMTALDVGSSTGGFTQCLLMHGAKKVYAVDVGRGQMDPKLRSDPRVVLYEKTDARELTEKHIPEPVDLIVMDVSFISATKLIPYVVKFLKEEGLLIVLVKPQFEVGPEKVKKGIVREQEERKWAVLKVAEFLISLGFNVAKVIKSKPKGTKGNEEFFILSGKHLKALENLEEAVEGAIKEVV